MPKALYRKYRPTKLADVIGEEHITNVLKNHIDTKKISHAYLFTGPRGTGKTSVARIFAHQINDFPYEIEDNYLDIIEIDAASNTGVENIRELREKAIIAPNTGKYKVYIIDEVHMLSKSAFNALLKTLEEPPEHVVFIMATTDAHKIPITITSRAQTYQFKLADQDTMLKHLKKIAKQEAIDINDDALKIIVKRGGGSFRDSLSLLDQISTLNNQKITADIINSAFGLPEDSIIDNLCSAYQNADIASVKTTLKQLLISGTKPEVLTEELVKYIIENPSPELLPLLSNLTDIKPPFVEAKLLLALLDQTSANAPFNAPTSTRLIAQSNSAPAAPTVPKETSLTKLQSKPQKSTDSFDWDNFLEKVKNEDSGIAAMLRNFNYEFKDNELHLYPPNAANQTLLSNARRKQLLIEISGHNVIINKAGTKPSEAKKDSTIAQISAIMGNVQEVKNGGENPF